VHRTAANRRAEVSRRSGPRWHCVSLPVRRLRGQASDVSLARELSGASATLNILPAPIVAAVAQDGAQMNVVLRLGAAGQGVALLARVTRKCWVTLGLRPGA
jgi:ABC-type molybdate transport system ATPase subunit